MDKPTYLQQRQQRSEDLAPMQSGASPEQKHTPGPWQAHQAVAVGDYAICSGRDIVAECYEDIRRADEHAVDECAANARLIAAAPELLRELKLLNLNENGEQKRHTDAWRVIARATGSES